MRGHSYDSRVAVFYEETQILGAGGAPFLQNNGMNPPKRSRRELCSNLFQICSNGTIFHRFEYVWGGSVRSYLNINSEMGQQKVMFISVQNHSKCRDLFQSQIQLL